MVRLGKRKEKGESFTMLLADSGRIRDSWGRIAGPNKKEEDRERK